MAIAAKSATISTTGIVSNRTQSRTSYKAIIIATTADTDNATPYQYTSVSGNNIATSKTTLQMITNFASLLMFIVL